MNGVETASHFRIYGTLLELHGTVRHDLRQARWSQLCSLRDSIGGAFKYKCSYEEVYFKNISTILLLFVRTTPQLSTCTKLVSDQR